jgi:hypothetical protein
MTLKEKYQIGDATWRKLKNLFLLITGGYSLIFFVLFGMVGAMLDGDFSWSLVIAILWFYHYLFIVPFWHLWFIKSKIYFLTGFLYLLQIGFIFIIPSEACAFRLFGKTAAILQGILIAAYFITFFKYYYNYWAKVWDSHKEHNEGVILDLANGRFDLLNNFDMTEAKIKKYSNPVLTNIALTVSPIGGAITLLFTKHDNWTAPLIIFWVLSIPIIIWGGKALVSPIYNFRKIAYYEKLIGKPIINGLLNEQESTSCARKRAPKVKKKYGSNKT